MCQLLANYLINLYQKIFPKVRAERLQTFYSAFDSYLDQVGFVPCREASDNTIRVLILMAPAHPCVSVDVEATFTQISLPTVLIRKNSSTILNFLCASLSKPCSVRIYTIFLDGHDKNVHLCAQGGLEN